MSTKKEKQLEKKENLKAVSKVDSLWEFLAFLVVVKNNIFWISISMASTTLNIVLLAKYTNVFPTIFKFVLSFFGNSGGGPE